MELTFKDFQDRARNKQLSKWEKIGFPNGYRQGLEHLLFQDIHNKLQLNKADSLLDIGCGCSDLVDHIISLSKEKNQTLFLVDSLEMLDNINKELLEKNIHLIAGLFPEKEVISQFSSTKFDAILVYSVLQYVFIDQSIYTFIHECIKLLKPGGRLLLGDIPNYNARERFLSSDDGRDFFAKSTEVNNTINLQHENEERIDDSVISSIFLRFRKFGCETYVLPQPIGLPFSNRREDILIIKR